MLYGGKERLTYIKKINDKKLNPLLLKRFNVSFIKSKYKSDTVIDTILYDCRIVFLFPPFFLRGGKIFVGFSTLFRLQGWGRKC